MDLPVVLITGCSTGIGKALAIEFASRNTFVFASARKLSSIKELKESNSNIDLVELDVTSNESIKKAVAEVIKKKGKIDILINNAGLTLVGPTIEVDLNGCRNLFETNLFGVIALIQEVAPHMIKNKSGKIVNIGSVAGVLSTPFSGVYGASKAALHSWSDSLRMELAPFNIQVVVIRPGAIKSEIAANAEGNSDLEKYNKPSSWYHSIYDYILKRKNSSQQHPTPTAEFAKKTIDQILKQKSPSYFTYGNLGSTMIFSSYLPTWVQDYVLSKRFGLDVLKKWFETQYK